MGGVGVCEYPGPFVLTHWCIGSKGKEWGGGVQNMYSHVTFHLPSGDQFLSNEMLQPKQAVGTCTNIIF